MATPLSLDDLIELNEILDQLEATKLQLSEQLNRFMEIPVEQTHDRRQAMQDLLQINWQFTMLVTEYRWQLAHRRGVQ